MKKAILVFTKVPKVGDCKTRLTEARGGILTPEEAATLYETCLLDDKRGCREVLSQQPYSFMRRVGGRFLTGSKIHTV